MGVILQEPIKKFKKYSKKFHYPRVSSRHQLPAKSWRNSGLEIVLELTRPEVSILGAKQKDCGLWGRECYITGFLYGIGWPGPNSSQVPIIINSGAPKFGSHEHILMICIGLLPRSLVWCFV